MEADTCDDCGAELETCCDGIERCLECAPCPACYDGGMDFDEEADDEVDAEGCPVIFVEEIET